MNESSSSRRRFLQGLGLVTGALATGAFGLSSVARAESAATGSSSKNLGPDGNFSPRPSGSKYMGDFCAPKLDKVKMAFIGVGARGSSHAGQVATMKDNVEIVGICDLYEDWANRTADNVEKKSGKRPAVYVGDPKAGEKDKTYIKMLKETKPDAVIISTPWGVHASMCIDSMENGAHAFVEVPIAVTLEEMWNLVDVSEKTQKHCMMMENCNYGREELCFLNMVNQGIIGDLLHGEAAYIHELRGQMKEVERGTGSWRTYQWANRAGNLYPTHGLGPVSQYMNCGRTDDMFARMVSFGSPAPGHPAYAKKNFPADHKWNNMEFNGNDMNTSLIKTVLGRTIMVQWDETSPRPYSRHNLIQGSLGTLAGYPTRAAGEKIGDGNYHQWIEGKKFEDEVYAKYDHPLYTRVGELAKKMGGHGGMDYIMLFRIVECLQKGEPIDQNVYEGCLWSAVGPLSEKSIAQGGAPQEFPDFTRGDWKKTNRMPIVK